MKVSLRTPPPYDAALHQKTQENQNFSELATEVPLKTSTDSDYIVVQVPAIQPWGILVVQP
jgi:hypothetical protein